MEAAPIDLFDPLRKQVQSQLHQEVWLRFKTDSLYVNYIEEEKRLLALSHHNNNQHHNSTNPTTPATNASVGTVSSVNSNSLNKSSRLARFTVIAPPVSDMHN